jgi:hypothetical protein
MLADVIAWYFTHEDYFSIVKVVSWSLATAEIQTCLKSFQIMFDCGNVRPIYP